MVALKLEHISKKYSNSNKYSVEDFNLHVRDSEFIVFVGPSGCGKSTVLRMIAGLEDISSGKLYIGDNLVNKLSAKDRDIAMVFQNYALYPHMTVFENMAFALKLRKYPKSEINKKVLEAAEILGLSDLLDRKPADMSGGQRQRVAMGRAIVGDSKIFLMDEPLSNLDAKLRVSMRAEIAKLHKKIGATTIFVTHDQVEAMTLADRIVIMNEGKIQQIASPQEVYNNPKNKFVASFMGSPAMNFFELTFDNLSSSLTNGVDFKLKLQEKQADLLRNQDYAGKKLIFGLRPEDISVVVEGDIDPSAQAEVVIAERMGNEVMLYAKFLNYELVSRLGADEYYVAGDLVNLNFNLDKAYFFDIDSEESILL